MNGHSTARIFEDKENDVDNESHIGSVDQSRHYASTHDYRVMTLQHTMVFCFLGLQWLQEPICLSDLIR